MKKLTPEEARETWLRCMDNHGWDYVYKVSQLKEERFLSQILVIFICMELFAAATWFLIH